MDAEIHSLFAGIPAALPEEVVEVLLKTENFHLERIVSAGQATAPGTWCDQDTHEWVVLLAGSAGLRLEGEERVRILRPGDYVHLPAHLRHRVEWTEAGQKTVWLALHYRASGRGCGPA